MSTKQLNPQQYDQAIEIMRNLRVAMRKECPNVHCIRTFGESRSKGRRLKYWGVNTGGVHASSAISERVLLTAAHRVVESHQTGLAAAGWKLTYAGFGAPNYGLFNIAFYLEKI
jgi:hypothetical protein